MEHSAQQLISFTPPQILGDTPPIASQPIDWAALNAARQQRVAIQRELVERRVAIITARHLEREQILASLNLPAAPFSARQTASLAIYRQCLHTIPDNTARSAIMMLSTALGCLCAIRDAINREWDEQHISDYCDITRGFSSDIYADLNTLQLLNFELECWIVLAEEPYFFPDELCNTPGRRAEIARDIEHETWGWEDGNINLVIENRSQRYDFYRILAEGMLRQLEDGIPSESLRDLSDLLTCIEQAVAALRDRSNRLRILRGDAR